MTAATPAPLIYPVPELRLALFGPSEEREVEE